MEITLKLAIKALSYNQYYRNTRTGKRIKTGAGLAYDEELPMLLSEYAEDLAAFSQSIGPKDMIKITIWNFKTNFYIKDGSRINKTAGDWDNPIKVLQDKIFSFMDLDDVIVKEGEVIDVPSLDIDGVVVRMERKSLPEPLRFQDFAIG